MAELSTKYKVLLFDLDHTLWDYETNSVATLTELFERHGLSQNTTVDSFLENFDMINSELWRNYNKGHIDRDTIRYSRFDKILKAINLNDAQLSSTLSNEYLAYCPTKTALFPYTHETLTYLKAKYGMCILTNGFNDVQDIKMKHSDLTDYFSHVVTSETSGHRKPAKEIFEYTLNLLKVKPEEALMIGDNLKADILGAQNANIDTVYFNPMARPHKQYTTYEIRCLSELTNLL